MMQSRKNRNTVKAVCLLAMLLAGCTGRTSQQTLEPDARERKFAEMMNGVTLVGRSTNSTNDNVSGEEQYVIEKVTKLQGNTWLLEARFKYGTHDIPIPMPVQIEWAGDSPVICVTDFALPGMDTYSARVVLHNGQYAGTWNGKGYGGQVFGKLVRKQ